MIKDLNKLREQLNNIEIEQTRKDVDLKILYSEIFKFDLLYNDFRINSGYIDHIKEDEIPF